MWRSILRSVQSVRSSLLVLSHLRLLLSLLVLGFGFWTVGQLVTLQILNRAYQTPRYVIANLQPASNRKSQIAAIKVKIYRESGISTAEIISDDPNLPRRELEFPLIVPQEIEQAIAQQLEIPLQAVKGMIYYRVLTQQAPNE